MTSSAIPAVIDALLTAARASLALAGVQVIDGPPPDENLEDQVILIGWSSEDPSTSVTETAVTFDGGTSEQFGVPCQARSFSGDKDMAARRTAVFALYDAVAAAADVLAPAGVNCAAGATVVSYTPRQLTTGAEAEVQFTIAVTVYR